MTTGELAIWLDGTQVAVVSRIRNRLRMSYTIDALERFPLGTPLLSLSMPLTDEPYPQGLVSAFLDGLLPEGESRRVIARDFGLPENDTFGLIRALGRDCAGALVIQPVDDPPPPFATTVTAELLTDDEIAGLVANLRSAPLGVGGRVRISLAGVQEKLLLTRMPDGRWGRPVDGTPSTHILKPEVAAYPHTVENEAFCMRMAQRLGIVAAGIETIVIGGRKLIVVERYDRSVDPDGRVHRFHQEDFCQAIGVPPSRKYQEDGGPSLRQMAGIVQAVASFASVEALLRIVALNIVLGNGDAHAKNFSLVYDSPGRLRLAPAYDLMSTLAYGDSRLAMYIDNVRRMDRVTADRIVNEAVGWGMSRLRATDIIDQLIDAVPSAIEWAADETPGFPERFRRCIADQLSHLQRGRREI